MCLRDLADERFKQKLAEGYKALAEDNLNFADQAISIAQEVLADQELC